MTYDIECPYCGHSQDIDRDDGAGCREDVIDEQTCKSCEKTFVFTTSIIYHYEPATADCLNGAEHAYKPTCTAPKEFTRMRCSQCCRERKPSDDEMREILK